MIKYAIKKHINELSKDSNIQSNLYWKTKLQIIEIVNTVRKYYEYKETFLNEYQDIPVPIQSSALTSLKSSYT